MLITRKQNFEYSAEDIKNLIKADIKRHIGTKGVPKIEIYFNISSEPGFDGPGFPDQILTSVKAVVSD